MGIKDPEFRDYIFNNLDTRYLDSEVYTLGYALTFGVLTGGNPARWKYIVEYSQTALATTGNEKPNYKHDCEKCIYLGVFNGDDLYYCSGSRGNIPTVISRYGEDGEYQSGMIFAEHEKEDMNSSIGEAYRRAVLCKLKIII